MSTCCTCWKVDILPTHNCHSCVGEVECLKRKPKDFRSGLAQHWQVCRYPTCTRKCFLANLLPFSDMEVNRTYTYQFYWPFTSVHGFPGNGCACEISRYQVTFSPSTRPGNETIHVHTFTPAHLHTFTPVYLHSCTHSHQHTYTLSHQHTCTLSYQPPTHIQHTSTPAHILTSTPAHIHTSTPAHIHTSTSSHIHARLPTLCEQSLYTWAPSFSPQTAMHFISQAVEISQTLEVPAKNITIQVLAGLRWCMHTYMSCISG